MKQSHCTPTGVVLALLFGGCNEFSTTPLDATTGDLPALDAPDLREVAPPDDRPPAMDGMVMDAPDVPSPDNGSLLDMPDSGPVAPDATDGGPVVMDAPEIGVDTPDGGFPILDAQPDRMASQDRPDVFDSGCLPTETLCGSGTNAACANLQTERNHCGTCGNACPLSQRCEAGACVCATQGQTLCGTTCHDLLRDPSNCGACGRVCPGGNTCVVGVCGAPRLDAMYPSIVDRGENRRVCLHGAFLPNSTVSLPGVAPPVTGTPIGTTQLCVEVPSEATAGPVTVRAGSVTTNAIAFRRTSFLMGLQPFRSRYEQTGYARQTPSLLEARSFAGSFEAGIHLYLVGGRGAGGALRSIERAMLNADGTLGAFERVDRELTTAREGAAVLRIGNYVYVIGGRRAGSALNTVERALVRSDGALDPFVDAVGVRLIAPRSGHTAVIAGGFVYVMGGRGDANLLSSLERAAITPEGELGPFAPYERQELPNAREHAAVAVVGQSVCLFGGLGTPRAVDCATITPEGELTQFINRSILNVDRVGASAAQLGSRVYVFGGRGIPSDSAEVADLSPSGSFSGFATSRSLTASRRGATFARVGNYVYLIGGEGADVVATLERAQFIASGTSVEVAANAEAALPQPRVNAQLVAIGPYVYVFSGSSTPSGTGAHTQPILRGLMQPDGRIGAFETLALNTHRASTVVVLGNSVFNVGAADYCSYGPGALERYAINADGSLAATISGSIASPSASFFRYVVTDRVLRVGGYTGAPCNSSSAQLQAISAPISSPDITTNIQNLPEMPSTNYATPGVVVLDDVLHIFPSDSRLLYRSTFNGVLNWTSTDGVLDASRWGTFEVLGDRLYALGGGNSTQRLSSCAYALLPLPGGSAAAGAFVGSPNCQSTVTQSPSMVLQNYVLRAGGYDLDQNAAVTTTWRHPLR